MNIHDKLNEMLNVIKAEVEKLITNRYIYIEIRNIFDNNSQISRLHDFFWWIYRNHLNYALMSIRRLYDEHRDCDSLLRFLKIISSGPTILSREKYVDIFRGRGGEERANSMYDKIVGEGKDHIDPKEVEKEIEILREKKEKFEELIDKRFAHLDSGEVTRIPKTEDLEDILEYLKDLTIKYSILFDGLDHLEIGPSCSTNWTDIFKIPWIQS